MFSLKDYTYSLPEDRIAQKPADRRDRSRLLVLDRRSGGLSHRIFADLPDLLQPSDLLVVNNTRVIPGRLPGRKETGGKVEVLILSGGNGRSGPADGDVVRDCLVKASKRPRPGARFFFDGGLSAEVIASNDHVHTLRFTCSEDFDRLLDRIGKMPLPPYILKSRSDEYPERNDRAAYQTVYAEQKGAVAAPTAGLHFTPELMDTLREIGITIAPITLHVGYGTFVPVRVSDIREHRMHAEWYSIPAETAARINRARSEGNRVIAVGTTSVRTLEYASDDGGRVAEGSGRCDLFIYPGYRFKAVDAVITNFHLPESTLLMLVSAFADRERVLNAYRAAVENGYRFYSYGDAMLIQ